MPVFEGEILLSPGVKPFRDAIVRVRLLDVSRADAPSRIVAEEIISGASYEPGGARTIAFRLRTGPLEDHAHYILGAHIDLQGTGTPQRGDLVTVESYPVARTKCSDRVQMQVEEIV